MAMPYLDSVRHGSYCCATMSLLGVMRNIILLLKVTGTMLYYCTDTDLHNTIVLLLCYAASGDVPDVSSALYVTVFT